MLELDSLKKRFGRQLALEGLSCQVAEGEIYGLLGHNGAGKSTTLGIILGMIEPTAGEARIGGVSVQRARAKALRRVGSIFESPCFYEYLSGWENLRILSSYSAPFDPAAAAEVVERVDLTDRIRAKVRTYSHGMRQRLALAQALLPMPQVLLLDEPTDGLDPEGIKWFRDFILTLRRERGMTVLFNSHLLAEVEQMCDRVAILKQGRRVFEGAVSDIAGDDRVYEIDCEPWSRATAFLAEQGCQILRPGRITLPPEVEAPALVAALVGQGLQVAAFAPVKRSLEDLYLEITQ
jgi:ABC-2 type transport system ATP-binding protein